MPQQTLKPHQHRLHQSGPRVKKQVVAGFVVYHKTTDGIKFLLLYKRGTYWNFPKGHFEQGENSMDTALRETEEETGLKQEDLRIIPGFRAYEKFSFSTGSQRIHDTVILFLAESKNPRVIISPREHSGFGWFLYHDAVKILGGRYEATRRVLRQAHDFLTKRRKAHSGSGNGPQATHGHHGARSGASAATSPATISTNESQGQGAARNFGHVPREAQQRGI